MFLLLECYPTSLAGFNHTKLKRLKFKCTTVVRCFVVLLLRTRCTWGALHLTNRSKSAHVSPIDTQMATLAFKSLKSFVLCTRSIRAIVDSKTYYLYSSPVFDWYKCSCILSVVSLINSLVERCLQTELAEITDISRLRCVYLLEALRHRACLIDYQGWYLQLMLQRDIFDKMMSLRRRRTWQHTTMRLLYSISIVTSSYHAPLGRTRGFPPNRHRQ